MNKEQQARNLYFQTDMTQTDIASLIGISDKTLYRWIKQNNWNQMKEAAKQAPLAIVEMLYKQLYELNKSICNRESPIPTLQEAETTRKLINSIDKLKRQAALSENIQVLMGFTSFLNAFDNDLAKQVVVLADQYLKEKIGHAPLGFYEEEEIEHTEPVVEQSQKQNVPQRAAAPKANPKPATKNIAAKKEQHLKTVMIPIPQLSFLELMDEADIRFPSQILSPQQEAELRSSQTARDAFYREILNHPRK